MSTNTELIARLRVIAGKGMADYFNSGHPNSNAITEAADALEAEVTRSAMLKAGWEAADKLASDANHELNCANAEKAGLSTSTFHLSAMVDELRVMLGVAMDAMTDLHNKVTPDEDTPNIDGIVPAAAYARFSNAHADLLYRIHNSPHAGQLGAAINAKESGK